MTIRGLLAHFTRWIGQDGRPMPDLYGYMTDLDRAVRGLQSGAEPVRLQAVAVADLPAAAAHAGAVVFVGDETGGATIAFSDGTDWRRVQDRNVVS